MPPIVGPHCDCGLPTSHRPCRKTSHGNHGKWFFNCSRFRYGIRKGCRFFQWDNVTPRSDLLPWPDEMERYFNDDWMRTLDEGDKATPGQHYQHTSIPDNDDWYRSRSRSTNCIATPLPHPCTSVRQALLDHSIPSLPSYSHDTASLRHN
ncbi:hypothetical protein M427DRAFT_59875 [Gonapodya prolifera JEL478]|uniref:GRF-type domain-containing protein n=1 Tax=Gonapodya prolifera (strain JEL478) TaxID=1344416 RepID=A0A139A5S8_GONPJ|nr:hypothetical protein M427DRAFT_59875 [Gonapodya prolifera JEL478]|eukprot:KXS12008.1 hypothetical protein M427DRAFT_59875 [Gonapodya prolifera JEL478]